VNGPPLGAPPSRRQGPSTSYCAAEGERICGRLEAGESLNKICADPAMPARATVHKWVREIPAFRERYAAARGRQRPGGAVSHLPARVPAGTGVDLYTDALADAFCERLAAGKSMGKVCADPTMPSESTVLRWLRERPDFRQRYAHARTLQGHAFADQVIATVEREDLTPADKQVRIKALTWAAARLAPTKYGEEERPGVTDEEGLFVVVVREETG